MMRKGYDFGKGKRGPVIRVPRGKTRITIRLDQDIVAWFKEQVHNAGGGNYQTLMNSALRDYVEQSGEPLEELVRRVVRDEIKQAN